MDEFQEMIAYFEECKENACMGSSAESKFSKWIATLKCAQNQDEKAKGSPGKGHYTTKAKMVEALLMRIETEMENRHRTELTKRDIYWLGSGLLDGVHLAVNLPPDIFRRTRRQVIEKTR